MISNKKFSRDGRSMTYIHPTALLLLTGAEIYEVDNENRQVLDFATWTGGSNSLVQMLIKRGADVAGKNRYQWTPLHLAARNQNAAMVKMLLDAGTVQLELLIS